MDKVEMADQVGEAQVWRWRQGYSERPPTLADDEPRHPARDPRWREIEADKLPNGESLSATRERAVGFWRERVEPRLRSGRRLLISSHGNTLRALIMALDGMSAEQVEGFEIPTGVPIVYAFGPGGTPIGWHYLEAENVAPRAA
jgi:2,3-bisphosphoglycerate-dependent phosphoglycerate mutase